FGRAHVHPVGAAIGHAAVPRLAESEDVLVEPVCDGAVAHGDADVNDALRDARCRQELCEIEAVLRAGPVLDELQRLAVRVFDYETQVPVEARLERCGDGDTATRQIITKLL